MNGNLAPGDVDAAAYVSGRLLPLEPGAVLSCAGHSRMADGTDESGDAPWGLVGPVSTVAVAIAVSAQAGRPAERGKWEALGRPDATPRAAQAGGPAEGGRGQGIGELGAVDRHRPGAHVQAAAGRVTAIAAIATVAAIAAVATLAPIAAGAARTTWSAPCRRYRRCCRAQSRRCDAEELKYSTL